MADELVLMLFLSDKGKKGQHSRTDLTTMERAAGSSYLTFGLISELSGEKLVSGSRRAGRSTHSREPVACADHDRGAAPLSFSSPGGAW